MTRKHAGTEMPGLAEKREGIYGQADYRIDNEAISASEATAEILLRLGRSA